MTETRPGIERIETGAELRRWYWLRTELAGELRRRGLRVSGPKFTLLERLAHHLDTGARDVPAPRPAKTQSRFDWHGATLGDDTAITDNYRNTQNVRRYFTSRLGDGFTFNIAFMEWLKGNPGRTLAEACEVWRDIAASRAPTVIKPHNQFNQYTRDFLKDNPEAGMDEVRRVWALKRARPSEDGRHVYHRSDLDLR